MNIKQVEASGTTATVVSAATTATKTAGLHSNPAL